MQNTDFITIHHYLKLVETSCKMKEVSCMSTKLLKHNFPFKQVSLEFGNKMIIGMPIFIHKKTTLYKNIYCYTKTITINRESYQFSLTYNVRSSMNTNPLPKGGIWIQEDNHMELGKNNTVLTRIFQELLSV